MGTGTNVEATGEQELPFEWVADDGAAPPAAAAPPEGVFRFPTENDPQPASRRLLLMALSASALCLLGMAVAARGVVAIVGGTAPGWYQPTLAAAAVVGLGLVVAAFLSIHRQVLPWVLLASAVAPLVINIVATVIAG